MATKIAAFEPVPDMPGLPIRSERSFPPLMFFAALASVRKQSLASEGSKSAWSSLRTSTLTVPKVPCGSVLRDAARR
jgi:hypothetical protein